MKRSTFVLLVILALCVAGISVKRYKEKTAAEQTRSAIMESVRSAEEQPELPVLKTFTPRDEDGNAIVDEPAARAPVVEAEKHGIETPAPAPSPPAATPEPVKAVPEHDYVLNMKTMKFHLPGCASVGKMKAANRMDVHMTRDDVLAMGYQPCGNCHP